MKPLGIIGFGNMGESFAKGILNKAPEATVLIAEKNKDRTDYAVERYGVTVTSDYQELCRLSSIILLATKPQDLPEVSARLKDYLKGMPIISILAGTTIKRLSTMLKTRQIIRIMPNLAAAYGKAIIGCCIDPEVKEPIKNECIDIVSSVGEVFELPESLFSAFTGLSGSGIAYIFHILHAFALAGTNAGIPYPSSLTIAMRTMEGAIAAVKESGENPIALLSRVISPGGTTIKGIESLEAENVTFGIMNAVSAAAERAEEIENKQ